MSGFDLLSLTPTHFEMVINKLQEKSYFRLQQTSKAVNEAIHSSKNICVHLSESYVFEELFFKNGNKKKDSEAREMECFYGVRFAHMFPTDHFLDIDPEIFGKNCEDLKKYRITCDKLDLGWMCTPPEYMETLIETVNPRAASVVDDLMIRDPYDDAQRCEVLLRNAGRRLEEVRVSLDLENTIRYARRLFSTFPSVHIKSDLDGSEELLGDDDDSVDQLVLLHVILKILRSQPYPNLRNFSLWSYPGVAFQNDDISFELIEKEFDDLTWNYEDDNQEESELDIDDEEYSDEEDDGERDGEDDDESEESGEDDSDYDEDEDDSENGVVSKVSAVLELPAGQSCKITWQKTNDFPLTHLFIEIGDPCSL